MANNKHKGTGKNKRMAEGVVISGDRVTLSGNTIGAHISAGAPGAAATRPSLHAARAGDTVTVVLTSTDGVSLAVSFTAGEYTRLLDQLTAARLEGDHDDR